MATASEKDSPGQGRVGELLGHRREALTFFLFDSEEVEGRHQQDHQQGTHDTHHNEDAPTVRLVWRPHREETSGMYINNREFETPTPVTHHLAGSGGSSEHLLAGAAYPSTGIQGLQLRACRPHPAGDLRGWAAGQRFTAEGSGGSPAQDVGRDLLPEEPKPVPSHLEKTTERPLKL